MSFGQSFLEAEKNTKARKGNEKSASSKFVFIGVLKILYFLSRSLLPLDSELIFSPLINQWTLRHKLVAGKKHRRST